MIVLALCNTWSSPGDHGLAGRVHNMRRVLSHAARQASRPIGGLQPGQLGAGAACVMHP